MAQALPQKLDCKGTKPNNKKKNRLPIEYNLGRVDISESNRYALPNSLYYIYLFIFVVVVSYVDLIFLFPATLELCMVFANQM